MGMALLNSNVLSIAKRHLENIIRRCKVNKCFSLYGQFHLSLYQSNYSKAFNAHRSIKERYLNTYIWQTQISSYDDEFIIDNT